MPSVRVRDNLKLKSYQYQIKIRGEQVAHGEAMPRSLLAMPSSTDSPLIEGNATTDPVFGMRAFWIDPSQRERAERLGYTVVEPSAVIATHLTEIVRQHAAELLGRQDVQQLLDNLKEQNAVIVEEVVPNLLTLGEVQKVLQHLLAESIPVRDLVTILETLGDYASRTKDLETLGEYVRAALSRTISHRYADPKGVLHALAFDPSSETFLRERVQQTQQGIVLALNPSESQILLTAIQEQAEQMVANGYSPVILCSGQIRLALRKLIQSRLPTVVVLGYHEIAQKTELRVVGQINASALTTAA